MKRNELARRAHKDYYDRCKEAIKDGYYLEALCLEYSAMESRVASILSMIDMPCGNLNNEDTFDIGIHVKLNCIKKCLGDNDVFRKSKLNKKQVAKIISWKYKRNKIIHRLFANPNEYETIIKECKDYAIEGFEYVDILYKEANRIRYIKNHKEILENSNFKCPAISKTCETFLQKSSQ